jgi:hypothetical protein
VRFLKRVLAVLFAVAAVLAGFVVAVVAGLLTLIFFPLRRSVKVAMPGRATVISTPGGVIDVEASEVSGHSEKTLRE